MSYTLNHADVPRSGSVTVPPLSTNNDTSLTFVGRGTPNFGQVHQTNFLHLLENFASATPPANPVEGQVWYNTSYSALMVRTNRSIPYNAASAEWEEVVDESLKYLAFLM